MRILAITDEYPWPADSGYRIRVARLLGALTEIGRVDAFVAITDPSRPTVAPPIDLERLEVAQDEPYRAAAGRVPAWLASGQPREVAMRAWDRARSALRRFAPDAYDLVWFSHAHPWIALRELTNGPSFVDLDNLEDERSRTARAVPLAGPLPRRVRARLNHVVWRLDERRWRRWELAAAEAGTVALCSDLDVSRLGVPAVVVPNGFDAPIPGRLGGDPGSAVLILVGFFPYPPNEDAARFAAGEILPRVRRRVPGATLRLVGRHDGRLDDLRDVPGVDLVGLVEDVSPHLASSALALVPIRFGSGTRVKVLEAFAHGLPVVSTPLGCEGLAVEPGRHTLVADDAGSLADAASRVLKDPVVARRVGQAGHELWASSYRWSTVTETFRRHVTQAVGTAGRARPTGEGS